MSYTVEGLIDEFILLIGVIIKIQFFWLSYKKIISYKSSSFNVNDLFFN